MMNSRRWLNYYEQNKKDRSEPKWNVPSPLPPWMQEVLARSLSHFQLGETGEGTFLMVQAREQIPNDGCYHEALRLFVAEEQEHARLLERLVRRFDGQIIRRHWTHALFRLVRHALGFKFEIQLLVIAELVGTAYYRLLHARARDPVLEETCSLLLQDEAQHIAFHADWLGSFLCRLLPMEVGAWRMQFQILFTAAACVAWIDHRAALVSSGATRRKFFAEARHECIQFLAELQVSAMQTRRSCPGALPSL
jgi:hypothetical protein